MLDLVTDASPLDALLNDTPDVVSVVLGTTTGELLSVGGSFVDGGAVAGSSASLIDQLARIGALLGFGDLEVASLKAATAARVFTQQRGAIVAVELAPRSPLGELEAKLRSLGWDADVEEEIVTVADPLAIPTPAYGVPVEPMSPSPAAVPAAVASFASAAVTSFSTAPAFSGDLEELCLPDLLEFLRNSDRTGLLVCTSSAGVGTIQLSRGMIIGADSPNAIDLREYFLTSPELDPDRRGVLATLPPEWFGDDLVENVLVSRDLAAQDEVERARVARIYSAFREMMAWTAGRFSFDPGVPMPTNPAIALSARSILMSIYEEQDEQDW